MYYENNTEKCKNLNKNNYIKNREKYLQKDKERRLNNKEEIEIRRSEKITCDICGSSFRRDSLARHNKTIKHRNNL